MSDDNQYQTPSSNVEQTTSTEYGAVTWHAASGRLGRIRYIAYAMGLGFAAMILIGIILGIFGAGAAMFGGDETDAGMGIGVIIMGIAIAVIYIITIIISIRMMIQRIHDFNASAWLVLIMLVPFVSAIFSLVLIFMPGTDGENQYGLKTPPNGASTIVVIIMALSIPVMGILAAIAIPAYQGYVEQARQMQIEQSQ